MRGVRGFHAASLIAGGAKRPSDNMIKRRSEPDSADECVGHGNTNEKIKWKSDTKGQCDVNTRIRLRESGAKGRWDCDIRAACTQHRKQESTRHSHTKQVCTKVATEPETRGNVSPKRKGSHPPDLKSENRRAATSPKSMRKKQRIPGKIWLTKG